jgi:hypothetical protein
MSNDFFNASGTPAQSSSIVSPNVRAEFAAIGAGFDKLPALTGNAYEITYINASGTAMASVGGDGLLKLSTTGVPSVAVAGTDYVTSVEASITAASAAAIADTDNVSFVQTSVAGALKKLTWANIKATIFAAWGALTTAGTSKTTPVDADSVAICDSAASDATKKLTWANIKATIFAAWGALTTAGTSKTTPVDADSVAICDSAASNATKKLTWANLKATLVATIHTWTAKQIFTGTMKVQQALEKITITAAAPAATQHFDWLTQAIQYFTTAGANNWTLNVRGNSGTTLDSLMAVGESITLTVMATMTGTPYYASAMNIDGSAVTPKWVGGTAPTSGDASCINLYTYTIVKTATATFTVIASKGKTT